MTRCALCSLPPGAHAQCVENGVVMRRMCDGSTATCEPPQRCGTCIHEDGDYCRAVPSDIVLPSCVIVSVMKIAPDMGVLCRVWEAKP